MRLAFDILFDYFFPSNCAACGMPISVRDNGVCKTCLSSIQPLDDACHKCGGQLVNDVCGVCTERAWYVDRCFAISEYFGVMKEILVRYKFHKWRRLSKHFAEMVYNAAVDAFGGVDIITAVPMTKSKVRKRGFNQSELVAKEVAKKMGKKYMQLIREVRVWKTQKDLNYVDRFLNVLGRFEIKKKLSGENILLIDDVFTTGATINECARLLKTAGAKRVFAIAFARRNLYVE